MRPNSTVKFICFLIALFSLNRDLAQITVYKEPHHKILFENEYVRLIALTLHPNDTTLEHSHNAASVVLFLTKSKVAIKDAGKPSVITEVEPGTTVYRSYDEKPVSHRVWTEDKSGFKCIVAEIFQHQPLQEISAEPVIAPARLLWKQKLVDAYSLQISGAQKKLPPSGYASLVICFSGQIKIGYVGKGQTLNVGDYAFFSQKEEVALHTDEGKIAACVLLELK
jgi:hypothetical protein